MRKKREETTKKTGNTAATIFPILLGSGVALVLILFIFLLIAGFISGGVLPASSPSFLLSVCAGLCAFVGARFSIQRGSLSPMVSGSVTGAVLCLTVMLISFGGREEVAFHGQFASTLLMLLAGGCFAGLLGKKKRKNKKKK